MLGHMRTGSSLLVHLLGSHEDIIGFGETHHVYIRPEDFGAATAIIGRHLHTVPHVEQYVLDKVLHKYQIGCPELLNHSSVQIIFIIRKPATALSSIIRSGVASHPENAFQHYVQQVEWVGQLSQVISSRQWTYTTYTELIEDTACVFNRLEQFLELEVPLSQHYHTTQYTGVQGIGDSGPHIRSGYIKHNIDRDIDPNIRSYLDRAEKHFQNCYNMLQKQCIF